MTTADFAALDTTALTDFLEDNNFPEEATAPQSFNASQMAHSKPMRLQIFWAMPMQRCSTLPS